MASASTLASDPYASRSTAEWEAVERRDPIVWGDAETPLTAEQLARYREDGYLGFPQLIEQREAEELLREANRMADAADPTASDVIIEPGSHAIRTLFRVHRTNDRFRRICTDPRLVDMARQILGSEVYLHQSRINFKPGFNGKEFFWHSDFETWHIEDGMPRMRAVSLSINLTENHEFNGPLMVIPGSHRQYIRCVGETPEEHFKDSLRKQEYGVPSQEALRMLVDAGKGIAAPKGGPGSATLFDCNTMHGSAGNLSPYRRTNLFLVFNSVDNALVEPFGGTPPRPDFLGEREVIPLSEL